MVMTKYKRRMVSFH